jgi:hypothetical protein
VRSAPDSDSNSEEIRFGFRDSASNSDREDVLIDIRDSDSDSEELRFRCRNSVSDSD